MVASRSFRIPPKYLEAATLQDHQAASGLVALHSDLLSDGAPQLSEWAKDKLVYGNLTLGALVDGRGRLDFSTLPNFVADAKAAVREARASMPNGEDSQVLQVFGNEMGVPTKYGPEVWKAVMEKVVRKMESVTTWNHQRGLSVAKSLEASVRAMWVVKRVPAETAPRSGSSPSPSSSAARATRSPSARPAAGLSVTRRSPLFGSDSDSDSESQEAVPSRVPASTLLTITPPATPRPRSRSRSYEPASDGSSDNDQGYVSGPSTTKRTPKRADNDSSALADLSRRIDDKVSQREFRQATKALETLIGNKADHDGVTAGFAKIRADLEKFKAETKTGVKNLETVCVGTSNMVLSDKFAAELREKMGL